MADLEPKEVDISFPRGDTCPISFDLVDKDGQPLTPTLTTKIYFTMKKNYSKTNYILQKTLSAGDITVEDGVCSFMLEHTDTASLSFGTYEYDIKVMDTNYAKTMVVGHIELTKQVTHLSNE